MPRLPKITRFVLKFFAAYFALILVVNLSGFRDNFRDWFAERCNEKYNDFIPKTETTFNVNDDLGEHDLSILFINQVERQRVTEEARRTGKPANLTVSDSPFSVWDYWMLPFIVLFALTLAMSDNWESRLRTLLLGSLALYFFTFFRFRNSLWQLAIDSPNLEPLGFGDTKLALLKVLYRMQSIEFIFITTFLIWGIVSIRWDDLISLKKRIGTTN